MTTDTDTLVARLRDITTSGCNPYSACHEAAARIEALEAEVARLRAQLTEARAGEDELAEALALFASDQSWARDKACDPNSSCFVGQAVARAALVSHDKRKEQR